MRRHALVSLVLLVACNRAKPSVDTDASRATNPLGLPSACIATPAHSPLAQASLDGVHLSLVPHASPFEERGAPLVLRPGDARFTTPTPIPDGTRAVTLYIDRDAPYRLVAGALFALGRHSTKVDDFAVAVETPDGRGTLSLCESHPWPDPPPPRPLFLTADAGFDPSAIPSGDIVLRPNQATPFERIARAISDLQPAHGVRFGTPSP